MKNKKKYYYSSFDDEVEGSDITPISIDKSYKYIHKNIFAKLWAWFYYRIIIFPIGWLYCKFHHIKYVGVQKVRKCKTGYFIYANHTNQFGDVFSPSMISPNKKPYLIVNSKNLNIPVLHSSTRYLGAMPLPDTLEAHKNFLAALDYRLKQRHGIVIYPEARLWPYYTGIRPYDDTAFRYPVKYNVPAFCVTTTYQTTPKGKRKTVVYVDGPYDIDKNLNNKQNQQKLFETIRNQMIIRSRESNYETCDYIKTGD